MERCLEPGPGSSWITYAPTRRYILEAIVARKFMPSSQKTVHTLSTQVHSLENTVYLEVLTARLATIVNNETGDEAELKSSSVLQSCFQLRDPL